MWITEELVQIMKERRKHKNNLGAYSEHTPCNTNKDEKSQVG